MLRLLWPITHLADRPPRLPIPGTGHGMNDGGADAGPALPGAAPVIVRSLTGFAAGRARCPVAVPPGCWANALQARGCRWRRTVV